MLFQNRREYIHVGSRATSLLRSVLKQHTGAHASTVNFAKQLGT